MIICFGLDVIHNQSITTADWKQEQWQLEQWLLFMSTGIQIISTATNILYSTSHNFTSWQGLTLMELFWKYCTLNTLIYLTTYHSLLYWLRWCHACSLCLLDVLSGVNNLAIWNNKVSLKEMIKKIFTVKRSKYWQGYLKPLTHSTLIVWK